MRICYIGNANTIHVQRWVAWFASHGHDVHLISDEPGEVEGVTLHLIAQGDGSRWKFLKKMLQSKALVKRIAPDVLHAHYLFGYGVFGAYSGFHPFVASAWGSDILLDVNESRPKRWAIKHVLRAADVVHVETEMSKKVISGLVGERGLIVAPFGVDSALFSPAAVSGLVRDRYHIGSAPVVISTRNLRPLYDVQTLIRAVPKVVKHHPGAKFIVAGSGELEQDLRNLADKLGVSGSVLFVGKVDHASLPEYLAASDVYVSTSLSDTISVSLLEAMACGLAPVVTDIEGNREVIKNNINGLLFAKRNHEDLADRVIDLIEDPGSRERMRSTNRQTVKEMYDWDSCMRKIEASYNDLVEGTA